MRDSIFTGAGVALVTPFHENGKVNYEKLKELIEFQIKNKTDALIMCGTTGESATLTDKEHIEIIKFAVKCAEKRVPIIAGTGSNDTAHAVSMSEEAEKAGVDGLLMVTPYYNKTSQEGLIKHYEFISKRVSTPIIVYNVPSRTGVNIQPETYREIVKLNNITGIKEANGDISSVAKTMSLCNDEVNIYSGNDDQIAPICALGGKGVISVLSNILPLETHKMAISGVRGRMKECSRLQKQHLALCNVLFSDVNPIPVKEAMNLMGMNVGRCRLPLCEMSKVKKEILKKTLIEYGLI
ncbi:MAG: 4-hydroxy-tetrahydrodipicolinate synthase [Clostridia bacterium]|nr:4-hydroxy-tetrahydrodipicolinate synthase [Clostridia bacterium]